MTGLPRIYGTPFVTTRNDRPWRIKVVDRPGLLLRIAKRFMSDCRDLWTLLTKGQPKDDPILPYRLLAETAKIGQPSMAEIDAWEADMFAKSGAWWFDPARYDGTPFAWPKPEQPKAFQDALRNIPLTQRGTGPNDPMWQQQRELALMKHKADMDLMMMQALSNQSSMAGLQAGNQQALGWYGGFDIGIPSVFGSVRR